MIAGTAWERLLKQALLGTGGGTHRPLDETLTPGAGPGSDSEPGGPPAGRLQALLARIDATDREGALLSAAALVSVYRRCGHRARPVSRELPPPSAADPWPECSPAAARHLSLLVGDGRWDVVEEWLAVVARHQQRVATGMLPVVLDAARTRPALAGALGPALGERGRWLARSNPDWYTIAPTESAGDPPDASLWETGTQADRVRYLTRLRRHDPEAARERLAADWQKERAAERAQLLSALEAELSSADEPFLEGALSDKSVAVRRAAVALLARLPGSRLAGSVRARLERAITFVAGSRGLLGLGARKARIDVQLPDVLEAGMEVDGTSDTPPSGKGRKAWWLEQMLAAVPPSHWCSFFGVPPLEMLQAARSGEWAEALQAGWAQAALDHQDEGWAEALLAVDPVYAVSHPAAGTAAVHVRRLWEILPPERREALLGDRLHSNTEDVRTVALLVMGGVTWSYSTAFTRWAGHGLIALAGGAASVWGLEQAARSFGACAEPACGVELAERLSAAEAAGTFTMGAGAHRALASAFQLLVFRAEMLAEIARAGRSPQR